MSSGAGGRGRHRQVGAVTQSHTARGSHGLLFLWARCRLCRAPRVCTRAHAGLPSRHVPGSGTLWVRGPRNKRQDRVRGQRREDPRLVDTAGRHSGGSVSRPRGGSMREPSGRRSVWAAGAVTPQSRPRRAGRRDTEAQRWSFDPWLLLCDITALVSGTSRLPPLLGPWGDSPRRAQRPVFGAAAGGEAPGPRRAGPAAQGCGLEHPTLRGRTVPLPLPAAEARGHRVPALGHAVPSHPEERAGGRGAWG